VKRHLIISAFSILAISSPAYAILGVGDLVSDPPVEANTLLTATELGVADTSLASIASSDALIATSVTTPCDGGLYTGVSQYLDGLDGLLTGAGVSQAAMAAMFPGWVPLLPDAIPADATIVTVGLGTYEAAVQIAQNQAQDFDSEGTYLASIEAQNASATGVLCAQQMQTEATLALASQIQMLRQLLITHITIDALRSSEELNEKAQQKATDAQTFNFGVSPQ
jgi:hypothetical protein